METSKKPIPCNLCGGYLVHKNGCSNFKEEEQDYKRSVLQKCKDEVARKYFKAPNIAYKDWEDMFYQLWMDVKTARAIIFERYEEACFLYAEKIMSESLEPLNSDKA